VLVLLGGGYIIDRWGTKKSITLFAVICSLAAALTAASSEFGSCSPAASCSGIGAEPLIVAVTTALAKWFKGKELSFAFGINLMIARLGSASADWSPAWARPLYANWQDPLWLATGVAGVSVAGALLYWFMEQRAEGRYELGEAAETEKLERKGLYSFSASYWYIVALCVVFYSTVFPFRAFAIYYFQQAHGLEREAAGLLNSMLPLAAMFATPLFGLMVDRVGKRSFFMAAGSLVLLPLFLIVTYAPPGPAINLTLPFLGSAEIPLTLLIVMITAGHGVLPHPRRHVAVGGLHRRDAAPRHRLRPHDPLPAGGHGHHPVAHRLHQRLVPASPRRTPGGLFFSLCTRHVDLHGAGPRLLSLGLFFSFMLWRTEFNLQARQPSPSSWPGDRSPWCWRLIRRWSGRPCCSS
jgi:MFS family permease